MTVEEVQQWIQNAKKGEKVVYYKGFLGRDSGNNYALKKLIYLINTLCSVMDEKKERTKKPIIDVVHKKISGFREDPSGKHAVHPADKNNDIVYEYIIQKR